MKSLLEKVGEDLNVNAAFRQIIAGEEPQFDIGKEVQRTVSPAIGEFAMQENARLREENAELRKHLADAIADADGWHNDEHGGPSPCLDEARAALAKP